MCSRARRHARCSTRAGRHEARTVGQTLRRELGAGTDPAIRRLVDLQLIDADPCCEVRSDYLWKIVSAARRLPAGDQFFDIARNPARCALLEKLIAGPVKRDGLHKTLGGRARGRHRPSTRYASCGCCIPSATRRPCASRTASRCCGSSCSSTSCSWTCTRRHTSATGGSADATTRWPEWAPEDDQLISRRRVTRRAWHPAVTLIASRTRRLSRRNVRGARQRPAAGARHGRFRGERVPRRGLSRDQSSGRRLRHRDIADAHDHSGSLEPPIRPGNQRPAFTAAASTAAECDRLSRARLGLGISHVAATRATRTKRDALPCCRPPKPRH